MQEMFFKLVTGIVRQARPASVTRGRRVAGLAPLLGHMFETFLVTERPVHVAHGPVALGIRAIRHTLVHIILDDMNDRFLI